MLLVDWLGRGGIAQTSESWVREARGLGVDVAVATRADRELHADVTAPRAAHPLLEHRNLAHAAAEFVAEHRPELVVVQNYVVPALERQLYRAVRQAGARLVVVIHDHRMHTSAAGTHYGLGSALRQADEVMAHSHYVGDRLARRIGRRVTVLDIPRSLGMLDHARPGREDRPPIAVHFGVLKRGYKGSDVVGALMARGVPGWRVETLGGHGYLPSGDLVAGIERSGATVLPYRLATQSGAIALAQALGSVPVASAVGGIPEQIVDGVTGILVRPRATADDWSRALQRLTDPGRRRGLAGAGRVASEAAHRRFVVALSELVGVRV